MSSKFNKEGYLLIDHRDSPGLPEEVTHYVGLPSGAGQGKFEAPSFTCMHCCRVVILNPLRRRDRAYCASCDAYICDGCGAVMAATGVCKPFAQVIDEVQEAGSKGLVVAADYSKAEGFTVTAVEVGQANAPA